MELPDITVDFYKSCIEKFLEEDKHDEEWTKILEQRKKWAEGLLLVSPVTLNNGAIQGYAICYETRYHLVLLDQNVLQMMAVVPDKAAEFAVHWLMQCHCWMADFQEMPWMAQSYGATEYGIQNPGNDPHIEFFRQRWQVKFARLLKTGTVDTSANIICPDAVHYKNRNTFVILYGTGKESEDYPLQFETHLISLIELLSPDCSNPKIVEILCKQVTNEVSVITDQTQQTGWHLDVFLINRVRELFLIRPQIVNSVVNQHINNLLNMKNEAVGRDLAGRFTMAVKQILPNVQINSLPAELEEQYREFIRGSDIK
jgi:hypothetical protein